MKNLIIVHLEYVKISKKRLLSVQLRRQRDKIRDELENKLGDDLVEEIQRVLDDCEELVAWELELESRLKNKLLLIERHKQNPILQITDDRKKDELIKKRKIIEKEEKTNQSQLQQLKEQKQNSLITQLQKRLARVEGKLETKEEEVRYLRKVLINPIADYEIYSNKNSLNKLIGQFEEEPVLNQGGQEILGKIKDILGIKRIFLNMRQETIRELQNCYNDFKSSSRKHTKVKEVNRIMSAMGGVANSLTFGIPKALGDTIEEINNSFKRKFSDKWTEKFKELLINDKENLLRLNKIVSKIYNYKELRLFETKYKIFEIDSTIWKNRPFSTLEEMERVIILLDKNLNELKKGLEEEEKKFKEFERLISKATIS